MVPRTKITKRYERWRNDNHADAAERAKPRKDAGAAFTRVHAVPQFARVPRCRTRSRRASRQEGYVCTQHDGRAAKKRSPQTSIRSTALRIMPSDETVLRVLNCEEQSKTIR